jgi:hypothetical protein
VSFFTCNIWSARRLDSPSSSACNKAARQVPRVGAIARDRLDFSRRSRRRRDPRIFFGGIDCAADRGERRKDSQ